MAKAISTYGRPAGLGRVPVQGCSRKGCEQTTKMAMLVELSDIEDDGTPGIGAVPVCAGHIEEMFLKFSSA